MTTPTAKASSFQILLLGIGFTFREKEWGVWMTGVGGLSMLAPIALGIYIGLN